MQQKVHIGIDLGGTKILASAINEAGETLFSHQEPTPREDYTATILLIKTLIERLENQISKFAPIGVAMPGSVVPSTGLVQNANSTWLNGKAFSRDLIEAVGRDIRFANDANCFALSEYVDGAGQGAQSLFGVILGTGVGGGLVHNERLINGPRSIGGEWGHCALPFATDIEQKKAVQCWCGQTGCIESWLSGPALCRQYNESAPNTVERVEEILALVHSEEPFATLALRLYQDRLARALAMIVNIFDPHVIVLGGGLSNIDSLYEHLPDLMQPFIFSDEESAVDIRPPQHGASSGVRGAARLWSF